MTHDKERFPERLRPLACHGVELREGPSTDWVGDCPFCGKEGHLFASPVTGMWDCKVCGAEGNDVTFMTKLSQQRCRETTRAQWRELSEARGGIPSGILKARGLGYDPGSGLWLLPVRSSKGTVRDIRRWSKDTGMMSTWGCKTQLWGMDKLAKAQPGATVLLCEGEWDGLAGDWLVRDAARSEVVVVAVPGATVFKAEWAEAFHGKHVVAVYDADSAGERGEALARKRLDGYAASLRFVRWPDRSKKGYDLRDFVTARLDSVGAEVAWRQVQGLLRDAPKIEQSNQDLPSFKDGDQNGNGQGSHDDEPAAEIREVMEAFEAECKMGRDMTIAVKIALAVAASNSLEGKDPLWMYIVGVPGCGKTLILTSLQASERCEFRSTLTAHSLVSGWRGEGGDPSLIPKLRGKTLVLKDFTEVLTIPQLKQDEIFSTLRGAYDGEVERSFGNGVFRKYSKCQFSMLAGVTPAIHAHRQASLGERFLKFQFRQFDEDHATALIDAALDSIGHEAEKEERLQRVVKRFLKRKLDPKSLPRVEGDLRRRINALVQLVAYIRAQVDRDLRTGDIQYRPSPEVGGRLVKQLGKLAMLIAHNDGKAEIDEETYKIIERVAFDTAHGFHLDVVTALMEVGGEGTKAEVAERAGLPSSTLHRRFEDLVLLGAIERAGVKKDEYGRPPKLFRVAEKVAQLWREARGWKREKRTGKKKQSSSSSAGSAAQRR